MQIKKVGQLPQQPLWEGKCGHCGCEIEVAEKELKAGYKYPCPTEGCGKAIVCFTAKKPPTAPAEKYIDRSAEKYGGGQ